MGLMTGLAIAGTAISAATAVDGMVKSGKAKKALDNLEVPTYENPNKDIKISTEGADIIKEEGQRRTANILNTLQGADASTMLSALPSLVETNNQINRQAALDIDRQMINREYAIANYEERLNGVEENRYQGELQGIGAMYNAGQQQVWNGINSTIAAAGNLGRTLDTPNPGLRPEAKSLPAIKPAGVSSNYAYKKTNVTPIGVQDLEIKSYVPEIII